MVKEFELGETYRNSKMDKDIMVLGVHSETKSEIKLAILWVDRESTETTGGDQLTVKKSELADWTEVEL